VIDFASCKFAEHTRTEWFDRTGKSHLSLWIFNL